MTHGIDYTPDSTKTDKFRSSERQPTMGKCFTNSWVLAEAMYGKSKEVQELVYVEGLVWGYATDSVLHAWNSYSLTDTQAVDWTHYFCCKWSRYIGIPFTCEEYEELRSSIFPDEPRRPVALLDVLYFPRLQDRIREILTEREL